MFWYVVQSLSQYIEMTIRKFIRDCKKGHVYFNDVIYRHDEIRMYVILLIW